MGRGEASAGARGRATERVDGELEEAGVVLTGENEEAVRSRTRTVGASATTPIGVPSTARGGESRSSALEPTSGWHTPAKITRPMGAPRRQPLPMFANTARPLASFRPLPPRRRRRSMTTSHRRSSSPRGAPLIRHHHAQVTSLVKILGASRRRHRRSGALPNKRWTPQRRHLIPHLLLRSLHRTCVLMALRADLGRTGGRLTSTVQPLLCHDKTTTQVGKLHHASGDLGGRLSRVVAR